jgi:hypothetical protein
VSRRAASPKSADLQRMASEAFDAHAALVRAESLRPALKRNPYWQALRDTAFARFKILYEFETDK